ncbi:clusterin-like protein 1 [Brienomyrus brachyistius]|uniref:clusterin-like protein 1 n=1 Tax=Brienomyrus brachyistius TaxID=42636 RepID=UPI0020B23D80|nr:clusterin-like protein 1 [Brienomyrus brachyistius]
MRVLLLFAACIFSLAPPLDVRATGLPGDALRRLSQIGEKYVGEEMKRALFGVKNMKEVMENNYDKHRHLMKSLRHSIDKKKEVDQLAKEAEQKLREAEQQCQKSSKTSWEKCQPCLEDTCKTFYTSTCRRGFSSFSFKVEEFFRRMSSQFLSFDSQDELGQQSSESPDGDLQWVEDSFTSLQNKVYDLYDKAAILVSSMSKELDTAFQTTFAANSTSRLLSPDQAVLEPGFFHGIRLDDVLESIFDFSRSVIEEFSSVITDIFDQTPRDSERDSEQQTGTEMLPSRAPSQSRQLCRDLRRQSSECWQLQDHCESCQGALSHECPSVRQLSAELNEISRLLSESRQQYEEVLQVVQRHADDTLTWLTHMAARFGWVAELVNGTNADQDIFTIAAVVPHNEDVGNGTALDTTVELNILSSPKLTLHVPAELQVEEPAFIQYVAKVALDRYKTVSNSLA